MSERIIGSYEHKHFANKGKEKKIFKVLKEYRKTAEKIARLQWKLFWKEGRFDKNLNIKDVKSQLSERFKQTCQYQVVSVLESFISDISNRFNEVVFHSSLPEKSKRVLIYLNAKREWLKARSDKALWKVREETVEYEITDKERLLARKIFKHLLKINKKPDFSKINLHLDQKVAIVEEKKEGKARSFDYWLILSTLEKGKRIYIPLKANTYAENLEGKWLNFVQIVQGENDIEIRRIKELKKKEYEPKTDIIAIDVGLNPLFATDRGDLFGRKFLEKLMEFDKKITKRISYLQKSGKRPSQDKKYRELVRKLREFFKNEVNRLLNRVIDIYKPKVIVIEKLDLRNLDLSKRMNRLVTNFGKRYINEKIERLKQLYNIEVIFVNPAYTSQECSNCGYVDKGNRKDTHTFKCKVCGKKINAQVNGARNILKRSSLGDLIKSHTPKKKVLRILVKQYLERRTGCDSAPWELLRKNFYYRSFLSSSEPRVCENKYL